MESNVEESPRFLFFWPVQGQEIDCKNARRKGEDLNYLKEEVRP
jgi:hypothetical protein